MSHQSAIQQTNQLTNQQTDQSGTRLTIEVALWVLIAVVGLALRLCRLDAAPLTVNEAREALLAWQATTNQLTNQPTNQPFLFAANALLFALFGASDALARLWPALFGSALVLVPALLRQRVGRLGALAAGLYLAVSPTALFASRQLDGAVVTAVGVMAWVGGLVRFLDTGRRPWSTLAAGGLALAAVAGPSVCGLALTFALACLVLEWAWPSGHVRELWGLMRPQLPHALAVFLLVTLALATGLGWNPAGLGGTGNSIAGWFQCFRPASGFVAPPVVLLAVYEPLALLFGLGGLVWAVRRRWRFGVLLSLWAGLQALMLSLMPGRVPLDTLGVVLPLALLTGYAVTSLAQSVQAKIWTGEWLYALAVLVLWVHFYLRLARHALYGQTADLFLALLTLILQVFLASVFVVAMQGASMLRGAVIGTGVVLLLATISAGWGLAHVRPSDPRELLVHEPTADTVRDLVRTLRDLSWRKTGMPQTLPFTLVAPGDPVAAWYLRDFSAMRQVDDPRVLQEGEIGQVLVTSWPGWSPPGSDYVGQRFARQQSWDVRQAGCSWEWSLQCRAFFFWLLFRQGSVVQSDEALVLWVR